MKKNCILIFLIFIFKSNAQFTLIPDSNFEQLLVTQNIDTDGIVDGQVANIDIADETNLVINNTMIQNLTGIEGFTALQHLELYNNEFLFQLNVSQNYMLKKFYCVNSNINIFNFTNNIELEDLYLQSNFISQLNISNNINLTSLYCQNCGLNTLDISNNVNLTMLQCAFNNLTSLDVSNNLLLELLWIGWNNISAINLSSNTLLRDFSSAYNSFITIDLSNNLLLEKFSCFNNNQITDLSFVNNSILTRVYCNNNINLSTINIQNGANNLLNGTVSNGNIPETFSNRFSAINNPNLHCVFVDDVPNCVANWLGVDATSNFVNSSTECDNLQIEEFSTNLFTIYPNPVNDILFIENNYNDVIKKIIVYNLLGKTIIEQNGNNFQLNFSNISSGLYLMKITTEKETIINKIIKK